jgi:hypothetical protein
VKIDRTPPVTTAQPPVAGPGGYTPAPAVVSLSATDALSGVAATRYTLDGGTIQTGTSVTVPSGTHTVRYWSIDKAGNGEAQKQLTLTIKSDTTPPVITATVSPAANAAGWRATPVTITFTCSDVGSGVAVCPASVVLASDGANQSITRSVSDLAGNTSSVTVRGISIDRTAPVVTGRVVQTPNGAGWLNGTVTVHWTCSDATSGLAAACPADTTVTSQGGAVTVTSPTVKDKAGNSTQGVVSGLKIDRTAPTLINVLPIDGTVTLSQIPVLGVTADGVSGIARVTANGVRLPVVLGAFAGVLPLTCGTNTITVVSSDNAGNATTVTRTVRRRC